MLLALFSLAAFAPAQSDQSNVKFTQGNISESATVSLGVPLGGYPGRGLSLPVNLNYSSSVWRIDHIKSVKNYNLYSYNYVKESVTQAIYSEHAAAGWKSTLDLPQIEFPKLDEIYNYKGAPATFGFDYRIAKVFVHLPDGSTHELRKSDHFYNSGTVDVTGTFYAVDGSRMRWDGTGADTGTLLMPDGTRYVLGHPSSQIIDKNGNAETYSETTREWTDTLGRVIANPLPASPQIGDYAYQMPGLSAVNGGLQTYTFKWKTLSNDLTPDENNNLPALRTVANQYLPSPGAQPTDTNQSNPVLAQANAYQSLFQSYGTDDPDANPYGAQTRVVGKDQEGGQLFNPVVLAEIALPDGTSYKFSYNVYGELDKVVYPTGAYDQYVYDSSVTEADAENLPYAEAGRKIKSRKLSENGTGSDVLEWKYSETAHTYNAGNPLDDSTGFRMTAIIAPDKTRTEIYTNNPATPADSSGKQFWAFGIPDARAGMVIQRKYYSTSADGLGGQLMRREITQYDQTANAYTYTAANIQPTYTKTVTAYRNPRPVKTVSLIFEGSGAALAETQTFTYDATNQLTTGLDQTASSTYQYAAVDNQTAQTGTISQMSTGTLANTAETTYLTGATYQSQNILGLPASKQLKDAAGNIVAKSQMVYDDTTNYPIIAAGSNAQWTDPNTNYRGNPATTRMWTDIANNQYIETQTQFDNFGNLRKSWDGKGNLSQIDYSSTYAYAYPTSTTSAVPDQYGQTGSSTPLTASTVYDYTTGLLTSMTDANGQTSQMEYHDPLLRPTKMTAPNGQQTLTDYGAGTTAATRFVHSKTQIDAVHWKEGYSFYDGLGRTVKTQSVDSAGDVFTETEYDQAGRVSRATNPHRANEPVLWTTNGYDAAGRVNEVTTPDGAKVTTDYGVAATGATIGTSVTVTDQAGKVRRSITNALGQLKRVDEPTDANGLGAVDTPQQATGYSYDTLNNLITVNQGSQTRSFGYDSLSRLKQASNPESGTILYGYDNNGNLTQKTDARNVQTNYVYDALNRLTSRSYANEPAGQTATPAVSYFYDNLQYAKGKLTKVSSSVSQTEYTAFDQMGRVLSHRQTTDGNAYTTGYSYNLSGALLEETYPSGRVVRNTLDNEGDLAQVQSKKNTSSGYQNYAGAFTYTAAGAVSSLRLGNGRWESTQFNSRLQPTQIALGNVQNANNLLKLNYDYGTTANNGNVLSQQITVPTVGSNQGFTAVQNYSYDSLNRLQSANETVSNSQTWKQTFTYDRYGNRNFDTSNGNTTTLPSGCPTAVCNPTVSTANNRFNTGQGYAYDAAGNVTIDPTIASGNRNFVYDGENKQIQVSNSSGVVGQYVYDGDGKRVKKLSASEITIFVYDASGKMVAEYSTATNPTPQVSYLTNDNLGTPRINTDASGTVISRHDYLPFGEEIAQGRNTGLGYQADAVRKQFTSYERDTETSLDYAINRYHSSAHGRFTSVDPYNIILEKEKGRDAQEKLAILINYISDPKLWNKYSYAVNNPLKHTDPDGRRPVTAADRTRVDSFVAYGNTRADEIAAGGDQAGADRFRQAVQRAAQGLYQAIDAVSNNASQDPTNLRALWGAIDALGNGSWAQTAANGGGGKDINSNGWRIHTDASDNKCNVFVAAVYALNNGNIHGAGIGLLSSSAPDGYPVNAKWGSSLRLGANGNLPTSSEVFSSGLTNFNSTNSPSPGDVVANGHHLGIWVGHEIVISATDTGGVKTGPMGTTLSDKVEYKYYTYGKP